MIIYKTALFIAVENHNLEMVILLLDRKDIDVNIKKIYITFKLHFNNNIKFNFYYFVLNYISKQNISIKL